MALRGNTLAAKAFWQQAEGTWEGIMESEYMSACSTSHVKTAMDNPSRENICWLLTATQSIRAAITALGGVEISDKVKSLLGMAEGSSSKTLRAAWEEEAKGEICIIIR